ncbi:MAG: PKD domain-containing protein, partial [Candidatus Poseidoniia archaeon]|nr:PKD domain-containing protein [Candidatus Poseidoniia archaeon]
MRKALIIAILMLIPGCLDTTPEEISGVQIQLPIGSIIEGDTVSLMASGQKPAGAKYLWDFGDDSGGTGENVQHIFVDEGPYTIVLTVVDEKGRIGTASENIEILHRNEFP